MHLDYRYICAVSLWFGHTVIVNDSVGSGHNARNKLSPVKSKSTLTFSLLAVPVEIQRGVTEVSVSTWQVPCGWALKLLALSHTVDPSVSLTSYSNWVFGLQSLWSLQKPQRPLRLITIHSLSWSLSPS